MTPRRDASATATRSRAAGTGRSGHGPRRSRREDARRSPATPEPRPGRRDRERLPPGLTRGPGASDRGPVRDRSIGPRGNGRASSCHPGAARPSRRRKRARVIARHGGIFLGITSVSCRIEIDFYLVSNPIRQSIGPTDRTVPAECPPLLLILRFSNETGGCFVLSTYETGGCFMQRTHETGGCLVQSVQEIGGAGMNRRGISVIKQSVRLRLSPHGGRRTRR